MSEFEKYIKEKFPVDYESLKEKYPNTNICDFYGDEKDIWDHRQSEIDQLKGRISYLESAKDGYRDQVLELRKECDQLKAEKAGLEKDKSELLGVISDALEAFEDGEFNYCQKLLETHVKTLRGEHD